MPQRILVLGASGYIGQHLVRTLSQQGHQLLAAARHVDRLAKLQLANVSCHKVDLSWPRHMSSRTICAPVRLRRTFFVKRVSR